MSPRSQPSHAWGHGELLTLSFLPPPRSPAPGQTVDCAPTPPPPYSNYKEAHAKVALTETRARAGVAAQVRLRLGTRAPLGALVVPVPAAPLRSSSLLWPGEAWKMA